MCRSQRVPWRCASREPHNPAREVIERMAETRSEIHEAPRFPGHCLSRKSSHDGIREGKSMFL